MSQLMASHDVTQKIQHIESQLDFHAKLHEQNTETLQEVKNVLVSNAKLSQQLIHVDKRLDSYDARFDKIDVRFDKMDDRVDKNHNKIIYWSGGIAAILTAVGITISVAKLLS